MSLPSRTAVRRSTPVAVGTVLIAILGTVLTGCSDSGPPKCDDYSASGARLAQGCLHDGTLEQSHPIRCKDGTTLYNVPIGAQGGVSGYSNGKIRPDVTTQQEIATCLGV